MCRSRSHAHNVENAVSCCSVCLAHMHMLRQYVSQHHSQMKQDMGSELQPMILQLSFLKMLTHTVLLPHKIERTLPEGTCSR